MKDVFSGPHLITGFVFIILLTALVLLWLLPGFIAHKRKHANETAIWVITIVAGWSLVGWIAMMIWANMAPNRY